MFSQRAARCPRAPGKPTLLFTAILLAASAQADTDLTQAFNTEQDLVGNFTQSNPASGSFTWANNVGLSGGPGVGITFGSDQIWTTKEAYGVAADGVYTASAYMFSSGFNGYGAVGFSIQSQDSNAGNYGAPAGSHIGAFYHGGGGGFLSNGAIGTDGNATANDTPIFWNGGGISSDNGGNWYLLQFTATARGSNKFDLKLRIYNSDNTGAVGTLVTEHTMTDDVGDATRVGPAVTNANVAGASSMRVFFSAEGTRMTQLDNFRIQLSGGATYIPNNALAYSATTFTEAGANDGSIATTSTITLNGDTFTGTNGENWSSLVSNVPAGLTAVLTRTSATTASLSFTGTAANHADANDIANLTVTFTNGYFTGGNAANIAGATTNNLVIDFAAPAGPADTDGVADAVEDGAPNGGDGDGDGSADSLQSNVASLLRPDGSYITLATDCVAGLTGVQTYTEASQGGGDAQYNMPYGLVGFSAACETAAFTVYYHGVGSANGMTYRKYGPSTPGNAGTTGWYTLPGVTYGTATVGGQTVATATFTLHDNQLGDDTGDDGVIVDQGGPGNSNAIAPVPTLSEWSMIALSGLMVMSVFGMTRRRF